MSTEHNPLDLDFLEDAKATVKRQTNEERETFEADVKWLLAHKQGRRIMSWLLARSLMFQNNWRPSTNEMSFISGMQNFGRMLWEEAHTIAPDQILNMMKEANDDAKRRNARSR